MKDERLEWFYENEDDIPNDVKDEVIYSLENMSDQNFLAVQQTKLKKPKVTFWLALLFGIWGVDKFYIGKPGLGILKILTVGGFGLGNIVDIIKAKQNTVFYNLHCLLEAGMITNSTAFGAMENQKNATHKRTADAVNKAKSVYYSDAFQGAKKGLGDMYDSGFVDYTK